VLAAAALLFASVPAYSAPKELDEIRAAIKAKGGKWVADETSVSGLSLAEKKMRAGLDMDQDIAAGLGAPEPPLGALEAAVPATLDWRSFEEVSYVSTVKNQGGCGSCWAFAVTAGLESQVMLASDGNPVNNFPIDLSEQVLISCSGAGSCSGGSSASASNYVRDVGLPLESCFKYTASNSPCTSACADYRSLTYSIVGLHRASSTTITAEDIKKGLYYYGPVVASMYVYNDFYSYRTGVYSYAAGSYVGAHAVLVVGYDDLNQCFIVKNSWGIGWGEAGFFRIAYSEVGGTSRFGYSAIVYEGSPGDGPLPEPPPCAYSLSATGKSFKGTGGSASVSVYSGIGCDWTASSAASWVSISSGSAGSGNGTVYYIVAENTGTTARSAKLQIAGESYSVTQQAARISTNRKVK
jgi:C1A family cysteine protease